MALKDTWKDLQDAVAGVPDSGSDITVESINGIAHSVIELEKNTDDIKPSIKKYGDVNNVDIEIVNNNITSYGIISNSLVATVGLTFLGFTSALYFTTPSEMPDNFSVFPKEIEFKGDSTDGGAFVPEIDTRYTIVFDYNGYKMEAYVSGGTI